MDTELLDVAALWSSDTGIAGNVIIVGVDNSSSSHADNCQLLELIEALAQQRKSLVLVLLKKTQSFVWVYIMLQIRVIRLLMENKSLILMRTIKMLTFQVSLV